MQSIKNQFGNNLQSISNMASSRANIQGINSSFQSLSNQGHITTDHNTNNPNGQLNSHNNDTNNRPNNGNSQVNNGNDNVNYHGNGRVNNGNGNSNVNYHGNSRVNNGNVNYHGNGRVNNSNVNYHGNGNANYHTNGQINNGNANYYTNGRVNNHTNGQVNNHTNGRVNNHTNGQVNNHTNGRVNNHTNGQVNNHTNGRVNNHTNGQVNNHTNGQVNNHTNGRVNNHTNGQVNNHTNGQNNNPNNRSITQNRNPNYNFNNQRNNNFNYIPNTHGNNNYNLSNNEDYNCLNIPVLSPQEIVERNMRKYFPNEHFEKKDKYDKQYFEEKNQRKKIFLDQKVNYALNQIGLKSKNTKVKKLIDDNDDEIYVVKNKNELELSSEQKIKKNEELLMIDSIQKIVGSIDKSKKYKSKKYYFAYPGSLSFETAGLTFAIWDKNNENIAFLAGGDIVNITFNKKEKTTKGQLLFPKEKGVNKNIHSPQSKLNDILSQLLTGNVSLITIENYTPLSEDNRAKSFDSMTIEEKKNATWGIYWIASPREAILLFKCGFINNFFKYQDKFGKFMNFDDKDDGFDIDFGDNIIDEENKETSECLNNLKYYLKNPEVYRKEEFETKMKYGIVSSLDFEEYEKSIFDVEKKNKILNEKLQVSKIVSTNYSHIPFNFEADASEQDKCRFDILTETSHGKLIANMIGSKSNSNLSNEDLVKELIKNNELKNELKRVQSNDELVNTFLSILSSSNDELETNLNQVANKYRFSDNFISENIQEPSNKSEITNHKEPSNESEITNHKEPSNESEITNHKEPSINKNSLVIDSLVSEIDTNLHKKIKKNKSKKNKNKLKELSDNLLNENIKLELSNNLLDNQKLSIEEQKDNKIRELELQIKMLKSQTNSNLIDDSKLIL